MYERYFLEMKHIIESTKTNRIMGKATVPELCD